MKQSAINFTVLGSGGEVQGSCRVGWGAESSTQAERFSKSSGLCLYLIYQPWSACCLPFRGEGYLFRAVKWLALSCSKGGGGCKGSHPSFSESKEHLFHGHPLTSQSLPDTEDHNGGVQAENLARLRGPWSPASAIV